MTPESIVDLFQAALFLIITLVSIVVLPGLVVGLIVAIFQAATQINEMTLSFIPRLLVTLFALTLAAPWLLHLVVDYTRRLISNIPYMIG